jgi:hypothetical protein
LRGEFRPCPHARHSERQRQWPPHTPADAAGRPREPNLWYVSVATVDRRGGLRAMPRRDALAITSKLQWGRSVRRRCRQGGTGSDAGGVAGTLPAQARRLQGAKAADRAHRFAQPVRQGSEARAARGNQPRPASPRDGEVGRLALRNRTARGNAFAPKPASRASGARGRYGRSPRHVLQRPARLRPVGR